MFDSPPIPCHSDAVVYKNKLYLLGGVDGQSEGKTQIATLYRDKNGAVQVAWTLGPAIPVVTGSAVAAVIKDKVSMCTSNSRLCSAQLEQCFGKHIPSSTCSVLLIDTYRHTAVHSNKLLIKNSA